MTIASTFVLAHGAWHGGWCYARVAKILRARGHHVLTPTFTGLGERSHLHSPAINASTHVEDIVNLLRFENLSDVVLVGHSYGGLITTKLADLMPDRIRALIYLDGYVGEDGCSALDLDLPEASAFHLERAKANGGHTIPPVPASAFGVNAADRPWVDSLCTPQSFATLAERLTLTGRHREITSRGYVLATGWQGSPFPAIYDRISQQPGWRLKQFDCGHDVMLDMPQETAALLEEWAVPA